MPFILKENSKIYLVCPANYSTGGTEVIHQLAYKLQALGFREVYLFYLNQTNPNPVHPNFEKYKTHFSTQIEDRPGNLLIVPEIHTEVLFRYKSIQKSIWWLSVDNYLLYKKLNTKILYRIKKLILKGKLLLPKRLFKFKKPERDRIFHLYQSEYARQFLEKNGVGENKAFLSDYLNAAFTSQKSESFAEEKRENIILYNPAKGLEFTKKLMAIRPDFGWVPIQKMSPEQVLQLLLKAKVYIDFGNHPGKDRLPREAAISGCCIVTGTQGAAANLIDIPISETYKFDQKPASLELILARIDYCLNNYSEAIQDFKSYRMIIENEEKTFEACLKKIFYQE